MIAQDHTDVSTERIAAELTIRIAEIRELLLDVEYALKHGDYGAIQTRAHWMIADANQIGWVLSLHTQRLASQQQHDEATPCT